MVKPMLTRATVGAKPKISRIQLRFGSKNMPLKKLKDNKSKIVVYTKKETIVIIIDGMNDTNIFPRNNSLSDRGVARRAYCFSLFFSSKTV
jgi:hypothetical protein